ncbi:MAG: hypothetical protein AAF745_04360 [Planctomycetota bacterium]
MTHRIRLRKPWSRNGQTVDVPDIEERDTSERDISKQDHADDVAKINHAQDVRSAEQAVVYSRRFNAPFPTQSERFDDHGRTSPRIEIELMGWTGRLVDLRLNDHVLEIPNPESKSNSGIRVDATQWIKAHNALRIELQNEDNQSPPRLDQSVSLCIHDDE